MPHITILIGKDAPEVAALAKVKGYTIIGDIQVFDSLNKDTAIYHPPYFAPPLGHVQTGQKGAVALAT